jgi:spermidine synthase
LKAPHPLKVWLSHLIELPVKDTSSDHNSELRVVLHRGRYKLLTQGAIYSYGDLYSNYRKTFERLKWEKYQIKTCLVLGLGLASIPDMLVNRFRKNLQFTAVEIDDTVVKLAYDFVLKPKRIPVEVFSADAASFLQWHTGKYDLVCSDVFVGDAIPPDLQTIEALSAMKRMLRPGGILLYNRLSRFRPDIDKSLKFRDEVFLKVFPEGGYLDVEGNWMFVNRMWDFR